MRRPSERPRPPTLRNLSGGLDAFLERRPGFVSWLTRYGFVLFAALAALFVVAGFAAPQGRGQQLVYATQDGSIVGVSPETGERAVVFAGEDDGFATAPLLNGGSRSLSFTVFRDDSDSLRGDLYTADLVRGTRAVIQAAEPGEAYLYGGFSSYRTRLSANRFSTDAEPDIVVLNASGATMRALEPGGSVGPSWTAQNSLYAWRESVGTSSLIAYDIFERRQTVVYRTDDTVGLPSYDFESNTAVFEERPAGSPLEDSRIVALTGTTRMPVRGTRGFGIYDPSLPVPELDNVMAVMWTDGEETGIGVLDPATWTFEKTDVKLPEGSREPKISYDGDYVATADRTGETLTIRRLEDGEVVARLDDLQPGRIAMEKLRGAGYEVPPGAEDVAPASFGWRSVED